MMSRWLFISVAVLVMTGCEPRQPVTRGQAGAIAAGLQVREGLAWGDPTDIQAPVVHEGRRWWQVSYGPDRVILVDADSGWARLPMAGYAVRRPAVAPSAPVTTAIAVREGTFLMVLAPSRERTIEEQGTLEREAARLNALARDTGLHPLFSVRVDRQGRTALVYGWQGDRAIAQDERIADWVRLRAGTYEARWFDLLAAER